MTHAAYRRRLLAGSIVCGAVSLSILVPIAAMNWRDCRASHFSHLYCTWVALR
jgi:hypothetical protein